MQLADSSRASLPSTINKMEDRKRPASQNELAPPSKRQAVNGSSKAHVDTDMPWKDDLEAYQKDAIYRQMLEYKREKATLEAQLKDIQKRSVDHDDHLRVVDAWWSQLLDEVKLLSENVAVATDKPEVPFPTSLYFKHHSEFQEHLSSKSKAIKEKITALFNNISESKSTPSADLTELRASITKLLAAQKDHMIQLDRLRAEKEQIGERLETASLRYLKAEKRLDRAKSSAVAKVEAQAIASTGNSAGSGIGSVDSTGDTEMTNGIKEDSVARESSELAYKEAAAVVAKQKEQLDGLLAENKSLNEQLTTAITKLTNLSDDDYAKTELFKHFRVQHEEVIKRINHLEATNIQLREEAEKFQAERTSHKLQIETEAQIMTGELESKIQQTEADLARIRSSRDELLADQYIRKSSQDQERQAVEHMKELVGTKEDRITALELELERVKSQLEQQARERGADTSIDTADSDDLRRKYEELERNFESLHKELPAMEKAYRRSMALASKKVMDFTALEEKVNMLLAEKAKADQKYFSARKDMDNRIMEVRALRAQNGKSSEIISQLKDVERADRMLLTNLEKQVSDLQQTNTSLASENKKVESSSSEAITKHDLLKKQVSELSDMLKSKDSSSNAAKKHTHSVEIEVEQLKLRYEQVQKERDSWKAKSMGNQSGEEEMLRALALCTVCRSHFKNTALKTCGHLFCHSCIEDRISNRMRKCPNCAKAFDKMDVMTVHM